MPRHIRLTHAKAFSGLRRNAEGWQLWSRAKGWQAVQLQRDSLALPMMVLLRFSVPGERGAQLERVLPEWEVQGYFGNFLLAVRPFSPRVPLAVHCLVQHLQAGLGGCAAARRRLLSANFEKKE